MSCKKKCPKCGSKNTKKKGKRNRRQRYLCKNCGKQWGGRAKSDQWAETAYREYAFGRQTLEDLSIKYGKSVNTIQKRLDQYQPVTGEIRVPKKAVNAIADAAFFSRGDGVLIVRANRENLIWKEIGSEKIEHYEKLIDALLFAGVIFASFVIDGRRGVLQMILKKFNGIMPVQICQFHQLQIITRYLSRGPKLEAGQELRGIALALTETDRKSFTERLTEWHKKWKEFLSEKTIDTATKRWHFTHSRLRSAWRSLNTNLPWLFTYQDYPELNMPNTTNSCDGSFAHWKNRLKVHRGLRRRRRRKMMNYFLENT